MNEVKTLEWMVLNDTAKKVHTAFLAGVALNGCRLVDNLELVAVGGDGDLIFGDDTNDREKCTFWLPAF